ncbi:ParB N-terminal domain-containing protein, partial [Bifidobacterium adolescentis]
MATKSRLGKGLGALFPSLPGEPQHQEHAAPAAAAKEVKASKTDGHVESKSASATAQASVNAVQGMKHAVSRETTKKNQHRRASMPSISLNESAHPADMFFGSTAQPASEQGEQQGSVSRETTPTEHKKDEPELLPVQGGYLVELRLSDVGPNLHQPRTIFDEDDLRELAESIKEVGVLQPIVVRKRPQSQIEAARREAAAKPAEPHNMFDGRMDSMYELIMGERRWRASQIAGLKTIPAIVKTT